MNCCKYCNGTGSISIVPDWLHRCADCFGTGRLLSEDEDENWKREQQDEEENWKREQQDEEDAQEESK